MTVIRMNDDGLIEVKVDGEATFEGTKDDILSVLKAHKRFMDYIDSHDEDGAEDVEP